MVRNIGLDLVLGLVVLAMQTEGATPNLSYTFRPIRGAAPALAVDLQFPVTPEGPSELVLPNEYGGEREMWRWISNLEVIDGAARLTPGELPFLRKIDAGGESVCHIRYTVSLPPVPLTQGVYRRPVIRSDYIHLLGNTFLVRPYWPERKRLRIGFTWQVPDDWRVGNSFGIEQNRQEFEASPFELVQSVYLAGDFRFVRRDVRGQPVVVAMRGEWRFSDNDFAELVARIVGAQRSFWRDDAFPFYFLSLLPVDIPVGSTSGVGRWNGFVTFLPPGADIDARLRHVLSHELFHTWNPGKLIASTNLSPAMYWFTEGFTEYYSYVLLLTEGLESFADFVEQMNRQVYSYWTSPVRSITNERAGREYFTSEAASRLAYARGLMVALSWNSRIRSASDGRMSLNDFMRALRKSSGDGVHPVDAAMLAAEAKRFGMTDAEAQIAAWVQDGQTIQPGPDNLGACAALATDGPAPRFRVRDDADMARCAEWFR